MLQKEEAGCLSNERKFVIVPRYGGHPNETILMYKRRRYDVSHKISIMRSCVSNELQINESGFSRENTVVGFVLCRASLSRNIVF